jgi:hypothetical protein
MERSPLSALIRRPLSAFTGWLIERALRQHFRALYLWEQVHPSAYTPAIVFAPHHYWWDGYLCYWLSRVWGVRGAVWMREWRRFPPFWSLGAMPFPDNQTAIRLRTIRQTLRWLQQPGNLLFLFPEGALHPAPEVWAFQRALYWLRCQLPAVSLLPMAMEIVQGVHQYPEAYIVIGEPFESEMGESTRWLEQARRRVQTLLEALHQARLQHPEQFRKVLSGRLSANERWSPPPQRV